MYFTMWENLDIFYTIEKDKKVVPPDKDTKVKSPLEEDKRQEPPNPHPPDKGPVEVGLITTEDGQLYNFSIYPKTSMKMLLPVNGWMFSNVSVLILLMFLIHEEQLVLSNLIALYQHMICFSSL